MLTDQLEMFEVKYNEKVYLCCTNLEVVSWAHVLHLMQEGYSTSQVLTLNFSCDSHTIVLSIKCHTQVFQGLKSLHKIEIDYSQLLII